jgi:hypothetical protein
LIQERCSRKFFHGLYFLLYSRLPSSAFRYSLIETEVACQKDELTSSAPKTRRSAVGAAFRLGGIVVSATRTTGQDLFME